MKRLFSLLLAFCLIFSLVGVGTASAAETVANVHPEEGTSQFSMLQSASPDALYEVAIGWGEGTRDSTYVKNGLYIFNFSPYYLETVTGAVEIYRESSSGTWLYQGQTPVSDTYVPPTVTTGFKLRDFTYVHLGARMKFVAKIRYSVVGGALITNPMTLTCIL